MMVFRWRVQGRSFVYFIIRNLYFMIDIDWLRSYKPDLPVGSSGERGSLPKREGGRQRPARA
jgi:hypothetical protein